MENVKFKKRLKKCKVNRKVTEKTKKKTEAWPFQQCISQYFSYFGIGPSCTTLKLEDNTSLTGLSGQ